MPGSAGRQDWCSSAWDHLGAWAYGSRLGTEFTGAGLALESALWACINLRSTWTKQVLGTNWVRPAFVPVGADLTLGWARALILQWPAWC